MLFDWGLGKQVGNIVADAMLEAGGAGAQRADRKCGGRNLSVRWRQDNRLGIIGAAAHDASIRIPWVDEFVREATQRYAERLKEWRPNAIPATEKLPEFTNDVKTLLSYRQRSCQRGRRDNDQQDCKGATSDQAQGGKVEESEAPQNGGEEWEEANEREGAFDVKRLRQAKQRSKGKHKEKGQDQSGERKGKGPAKKEARKWDEGARDVSKLDYTDAGGRDSSQAFAMQGDSRMDEGLSEAEKRSQGWGGALAERVLRGAGMGALEAKDLEPALEAVKRKLMERNVAEEAARALCEGVRGELEGRKQAALSSVAKEVERALERSLTRMLSPSSSIRVLWESKSRQRKREKPYTIAFVGVNGVGKSTTLAKVASWLKSHDVSASVAACDTFRAGAVEQLRTHCHRLGLPLEERGYGKDAASVAREALANAQRRNEGCLLVDTAGRMQGNDQLMRELASLISRLDPDLVLFVGEALAGNDSVDQLKRFSSRLEELTGPRNPRGVDGIALTKMDTVDDKAGAAVSMAFASGAPILFSGVGQSYRDLTPLPVPTVVRSLLK